MSERRAMKRLLALRLIEEEREEAELRRLRQLRQVCLEALEANELRKAVASRALHAALDSGDRTEAISAEMALACGPMERHILQQRLTQLDATVAIATGTWRTSRTRRLQMEALVETAETHERKKTLTREQKMMDRWFLSSQPRRLRTGVDESFQREQVVPAEHGGTMRAKSVHG
jgi:flagellar biosynthesis chaperone FliJ